MPKSTTRCKLSQDTIRITLYYFIQLLSVELLKKTQIRCDTFLLGMKNNYLTDRWLSNSLVVSSCCWLIYRTKMVAFLFKIIIYLS
jgi:hypothetical protein